MEKKKVFYGLMVSCVVKIHLQERALCIFILLRYNSDGGWLTTFRVSFGIRKMLGFLKQNNIKNNLIKNRNPKYVRSFVSSIFNSFLFDPATHSASIPGLPLRTDTPISKSM